MDAAYTRSYTTQTCVGLFFALAVIWGCTRDAADPLSEVRTLVNELVPAVEDRRAEFILSRVGFDFRTEDGLTYADVQSIVLEYLVPEDTLGARLESLDVTPGDAPEEIRAVAEVRFARGARLSGRTLPTPPDSVLYEFDILFRRLAGEWRAAHAEYRRRSTPAP